MGQHCAKGRYLDPENFSKELVLNFNLGPLKDLDGLIDEVLALDSAVLFEEASYNWKNSYRRFK